MKTLLAIASYGGLPFLKVTLQEVLNTSEVDTMVTVSKPGDQEMVDYLMSMPVDIIGQDPINRGFAANVNDAYQRAFVDGDYDAVIILGNDCVVMPGAIYAMIKTAQETGAEMVCGSEFNSKFLFEHYPAVRRFFSGDNLIVSDEGLNSRIWEIHKDFRTGVQPDTLKDVRNFTLFTRAAFEKVGYDDVNYWPNGYFADNCYARRCHLANVNAVGLLEGAFYHWWSRTVNQNENRPHGAYFNRNQEFYVHQWGGGVNQEKYTLPFDGRGFQLSPEIFLAPDVKIASRDQEQKIIEFWSSL